MKWTELSVLTTTEAVEAVSNIFHEAGASGVVIEESSELSKNRENQYGEIYELNPDDYPAQGVVVKAYLPASSFLAETIEEIKLAIANLKNFDINVGENILTTCEVHEEDWATAWKQYYHPIKVSERFTIVPTWEDYHPKNSDEIIIELDPGMAFGTGTHPTTVMCLQALEKTVKAGDVVIDVGTGSGVLSIASALLGANKVHAFDLDPVAVKSAQENVQLNHVEKIVEVEQGNLLEKVQTEADVVVANILAEVIMTFTDDAYSIIKPGGFFITSGIIGAKKEVVKSALEKSGFNIEEVLMLEDWVSIIAKK
ncbi:50S ribosomal protein L11 methyltransferase [Ureibacillus sp. FSL K6-2830]|uniref:50S ribosomal protein L11 methyltransferase n=1 Tax=Ureibacillus sp. FSL K6-2830 TaxID=2954610 RepID=UPI0030FA34DA